MFEDLGEFFAMLDRVQVRAYENEREFWEAHPDGIDIEYTDGTTLHIEGPSESE